MSTNTLANAVLVLKVGIPDSEITRTINFDPDISVQGAIARIVSRNPVKNVEDYGLFLPKDKNNTNVGIWLDEQRILKSYGLASMVQN